ncbi:hypothetical protein BHE74_00040037, partial [Ensete ventricosum]
MHHLGNSKYSPFPTVEFRSVFHALSRKFKIPAIPDVLAYGKSYEHGFTKKCDSHKLCTKSRSRVSIGFSCTVSEIQNTGHSRRLARGKSYEHGFTKKRDGQKLCAKSRAESSFNRFFVHCLGNSKYWPFPTVEFRSVLCAPSRKFKILANPNVLAH